MTGVGSDTSRERFFWAITPAFRCPSSPNQLTKSPSVKPIYGWGEMEFIEVPVN